jgi:hypothetical protein
MSVPSMTTRGEAQREAMMVLLDGPTPSLWTVAGVGSWQILLQSCE